MLVISNHPPDKWSKKQKEGWTKIDYIPFPDVPPNLTMEEVNIMYAQPLLKQIAKWYEDNPEGFVCIQGDFSLCSLIYQYGSQDIGFVFPTTKRVATEVINPDGITTKVIKFEFVRWRGYYVDDFFC